MYQSISEEMLNLFSTITEFSNLLGKPVDQYRTEYKDLNILRRMFFDRVSSTPDLDRYMEYFKWIDSAISVMVEDLFPVSARFSTGVSNIIDSHILERNKYQRKFPLTTRYSSTEGSLRGVTEVTYNWETGHAPVEGGDNNNCLWQKDRKQRTDIADRESIRKTINLNNSASLPILHQSDGTAYSGSAYVFRNLSKPYILKNHIKRNIHGGINYEINKDRSMIHSLVERAGEVSGGVPQNIFLVGSGTGKGVLEDKQCDDRSDPNEKKKTHVEGFAGKYANSFVNPDGPNDEANQYFFTFGNKKIPINIVSGTLNSGYNATVAQLFHSESIFTNIHSDTTDLSNEIPMQGPFTQNWVGGHQHRHIDLNVYDADRRDDDTGGTPLNGLHNEYTRAEAWQLLFGEYTTPSGAFGFVGADYGGPYPDPARKAATLYREDRAKRPVNIRNIKTTASTVSPLFSLGNYKENYEIVQSFGKQENNLYFVKNPEQSLYLPTQIASVLPTTTHPMTLLGVNPLSTGNVFGTHSNNRQPDQKAVAGANSTGSFSVYGRRHVSSGTKLAITSSTSEGYVINETVTGYTTIETGSTDQAFWNDLETNIEADQSYLTVNRINTPAETSAAPFIYVQPSVGATHRNFLSGTYFDPAGTFTNRPFSWAGWLFISSSTILNSYIYSQSSSATSGNGYARQIRYSGGSTKTIYFKTNYVLGGATKYIEWFIRPAEHLADVQDQWFHFAVSHNSSSTHAGTASSDVKMYINGEERTLLQAGDVSMASGFTANQPNGIYFLMNQNSGSGVNFGRNEMKGGGLANVGVYGAEISNASVRNIYSGSVFSDYRVSDATSAGSLVSYLPLTGTILNGVRRVPANDGEQIPKGPIVGNAVSVFEDVVASLQSATASCNVAGNMRFGTSPEITKSFAVFSLTASTQTAATNGAIVQENASTYPTFFSLNNLAGGVSPILANDIVNTIITGSVTNTIISSRFSAPGGIEVNSLGYLDVYSREYSAYNDLNFRNITVRSSGSGEANTIRANSQNNYREGLQTLLRRHCGQFGSDSQHAQPVAESYVVVPNFHKIQRNGRRRPTDASTIGTPVLKTTFDNSFVTSLIPQSDFQYSWVTSSLGNNYSITSGKQRIYGFTPNDGILSSSVIIDGDSGFVAALNFPTASEIFGE